MSFLDNSKTAGTAIWIVGIISIILGIVGLISGVLSDETDTAVAVIGGLGGILVGLVYFGFGKSIRSGEITGKWEIVCRIVYLTGIVFIINGIFGYNGDGKDWAIQIAKGIVLGLVCLFIHKRMTDGKTDVLDKILWILLVVISIIYIIISLLDILVFPIGTITGICGLLIGLFLIISLFDDDVKKKMGI